ncbi:arginyl-tRNA--protein transferase 1 isoform X8 [Carassius gibelio]|uniref:arginyl-tRNA--protein transferase 1 isoform X8 n=1 Tax=Carassius gibelio TaxID=101364 RepID=UPI0022779F0A|nr:arginyl-tRNA--protein transferase 1 isoform X8 [Carassius gibelio]
MRHHWWLHIKEMYSIVELKGVKFGYRCGYCGNAGGKASYGMWSHTMTVQDYQDLIDRGWRRSGKYVYKPLMNKTCCPQYTIRCHALSFHPSKTHKKTLKKVNRFLSKGEMPVEKHDEGREGEPMDSVHEEGVQPPPQDPLKIDHSDVQDISPSPDTDTANSAAPTTPRDDAEKTTAVTPKPGKGADPNRPLCRKAKDLRKERRLQKEQQKQQEAVSSSVNPSPAKSSSNQPKSLEEFITESLPNDPLHRLEVRLVRSNPPSPQFKASFDASYQVYKLYQMTIHKDPPDKPTESQFKRFLCDSPLEGQYRPSDLLCPETYTWVPIERCIPRLDISAYSRLNENARAGDAHALKKLGRVLVLHRRTVMPYAAYARKRKGSNDEKEVEQYASLVGQTCAERILLYRA